MSSGAHWPTTSECNSTADTCIWAGSSDGAGADSSADPWSAGNRASGLPGPARTGRGASGASASSTGQPGYQGKWILLPLLLLLVPAVLGLYASFRSLVSSLGRVCSWCVSCWFLCYLGYLSVRATLGLAAPKTSSQSDLHRRPEQARNLHQPAAGAATQTS